MFDFDTSRACLANWGQRIGGPTIGFRFSYISRSGMTRPPSNPRIPISRSTFRSTLRFRNTNAPLHTSKHSQRTAQTQPNANHKQKMTRKIYSEPGSDQIHRNPRPGHPTQAGVIPISGHSANFIQFHTNITRHRHIPPTKHTFGAHILHANKPQALSSPPNKLSDTNAKRPRNQLRPTSPRTHISYGGPGTIRSSYGPPLYGRNLIVLGPADSRRGL